MHVIGTAGHVDHGKSTLVEKLTGMDPDRFTEEKRRGLTIDLGFAWFTTPSNKEVGIIDVPGHERFIKNMLAGAGGMSVCLFVVAANEGWMPQSSEHLAILDVLTIHGGVVALTKADLVDEVTLALTLADIEERLGGTSLEGAPVVACSATDGRGLDELVNALDTVLESTPAVEDISRPRLWIDRVFTIAGAGTVVTGTLTGGAVATGDAIEIAPEGRAARIRSIQSHKRDIERAEPGNRVALNLVGLDRGQAKRGDAVVKPREWRATNRIDALVRVLPEQITGLRHELTERGALHFYSGSAETPVRVSLLEDRALHSGEEGLARLWLRDPLPLARDDRFVLRDAGRVLTFGGGRVLDPIPPRKKPGERHISLLHKLASARSRDVLTTLVDSEGTIDEMEALFRSGTLKLDDSVIRLGSRLVSQDRLVSLESQLTEALQEWHERHPLEQGMGREALRNLLNLPPDEFDDLVARAVRFVHDGPKVRLESFSISLDPAQERDRKTLIGTIEAGGFTPPLKSELTAPVELVRSLAESGTLVSVGNFYLTRDQAERARNVVRTEIEKRGPLTVAQIRDLLGTTRKYAVPLCEWLDQTNATRRRGDVRVLGPSS